MYDDNLQVLFDDIFVKYMPGLLSAAKRAETDGILASMPRTTSSDGRVGSLRAS